MEHYYVINGNEFGADLTTKKNFKPEDKQTAEEYFEKVKEDDFGCLLMHVDENGKEKELKTFFDEE